VSTREQRIEKAAISVTRAREGRGLYVNLCNPMDVNSVRDAISWLSNGFHVGSRHVSFGCTPEESEKAAARNLGKLCRLLVAHLS
jgi:hypothetical protein